MDQSTHAFHVPLSRCTQDRAGTEEQQALEERMVEHVKNGGDERQRGRNGKAARFERQGQTETDEDDADVLDRVVRKQPLQVVFHQRMEDAEQCGDSSNDQNGNAPPPGRRAGQIKDDPDESIHRHFGHDTAHQRRDMAGCCRMRQR